MARRIRLIVTLLMCATVDVTLMWKKWYPLSGTSRASDPYLRRLRHGNRQVPICCLHWDASIDGLGATLEQGHPGSSVCPTVYMT